MARRLLRILEFDVARRAYTGKQWRYPLEASGHAIGDFNLIDATRALVIERDNKEGDPRLRCTAGPKPDCFAEPAAFKRVYLVDLARANDQGVLEKLAYIDLLAIADPDGIARSGTRDGVFTFPFVTIENVDMVDERTIVVANDNNFPFSNGRQPRRGGRQRVHPARRRRAVAPQVTGRAVAPLPRHLAASADRR